MARIRTIKPQFWEDKKIARLSRDARLLFIGSWNWANDEGVLLWSSEYLRSRVFPYDNFSIDDISKLQSELTRSNIIYSYKSGRDYYGIILNFHKHQVINRPQPSALPPPSLYSNRYKEAIFRRDKNICHYCNRICRPVSRDDQDTGVPSIDHLIPKSEGGNDYPRNLVTACNSCNKSKGTKDEGEFREYMNNHGGLNDKFVKPHGAIIDGIKKKEYRGKKIDKENPPLVPPKGGRKLRYVLQNTITKEKINVRADDCVEAMNQTPWSMDETLVFQRDR